MTCTVFGTLATRNKAALGFALSLSLFHGLRVNQLAQHNTDESAHPQSSDALLTCLAGMRQGDERALEQLYDATVGKLYALAVAILKIPEEAEEIVCSTYAHAWTNVTTFDAARGSVIAWLTILCRSRCLDRLRQIKSHGTKVDVDAVAKLASPDDRPDDLLNLLQTNSRIHMALGKLSAVRRQLVDMAFLQGLTHQEIAERTGMALGTVKSHVRRALTQLREELGAS